MDILLKLSIDERLLPIIFNSQSENNSTPRHTQLFNLCQEILTCTNTVSEETRKTRKYLKESSEKRQTKFLGLKLACLLSKILTCPEGEPVKNTHATTLNLWVSPMVTLNEYAGVTETMIDQLVFSLPLSFALLSDFQRFVNMEQLFCNYSSCQCSYFRSMKGVLYTAAY